MRALEQLIPRLPVRDVGRQVRFYTELLGFRETVAWPPGNPSLVILERDGQGVGFFRSEATAPGAELYLRVADARALHRELEGRVPVEWGPEVYSYGCREFGVRDPEGYLLVFTERTDEPPTTDEPSAGGSTEDDGGEADPGERVPSEDDAGAGEGVAGRGAAS